MAGNHLDGLQFEHVAHFPGALRDEAFDGMGQRIETCRSGEAARQGVHQFGINHGDGRDVIRVDTHHLLLVLLVGDHIVDGHLSSRTSRWGECDDGHRLVARRSYAFERNNVSKFGIIRDDTHCLSRVDAGTAADGQNEVCTRSSISFNAVAYVGHRGVLLDVAEHLVGDGSSFKHVEHLLGHAELDQVFVCADKCFVQTEALHLFGQFGTATGTEIRHFVKYESMSHGGVGYFEVV